MKKYNITRNDYLYLIDGLKKKDIVSELHGLENIPPSCFLSKERILKDYIGEYYHQNKTDFHTSSIKVPSADALVSSILTAVLELRLRNQMMTIIDLKGLTNKQIKCIYKIAKKRKITVNTITLNKSHSKTQQNNTGQLVITPNLLNTSKIDVFGDIHGLKKPTLDTLYTLGWKYDGVKLYHPDNRKVLFLGDIINRGDDSIPLLKLAYETEKSGNGYLLLGNHEDKLIKSYRKKRKEGVYELQSLSNGETFINFLSLPEKEQLKLYRYLKSRPHYYCLYIDKTTGDVICKDNNNLHLLHSDQIARLGFVHAGTAHFNPYSQSRFYSLYGPPNRSSTDNDIDYHENYLKNINQHILFRGHRENTVELPSVFSLEHGQSLDGSIAAISIDKYINDLKKNNWKPTHELFIKNLILTPTYFSYPRKVKEKTILCETIEKLLSKQLISIDKSSLLSCGAFILKHVHQHYHEDILLKYPILKSLNGMMLNANYDILILGHEIKHNENQPDDKESGITLYVAYNTITKDILFSTIDEINPDIAQLIPKKEKEKMLSYLKQNQDDNLILTIKTKERSKTKTEVNN